jgi:hypothetical protein
MATSSPSILFPYSGPDSSGTNLDVCLYLRPESNGISVEKSLFRVIHNVPKYKKSVKLVYLVNLPGEFLRQNQVIQNHYHVREFFARYGKKSMTQGMLSHFKVYFGLDPMKSEILGAYEAMEKLNLTEKELFNIWVEPYEILVTCGQIIKHYKDVFIINYDIPYLMKKELEGTDIAAMIFRFELGPDEIHNCLEEMRQSLVLDNILDPLKPPARVFHYSKSPFDLLLDSMGHLVDAEGKLMGWQASSFGRFLLENGLTFEEVESVIKNPILQFQVPRVGLIEEHINVATADFSYQEALDKYRTHVGHIILEPP